MKRLKTAAGLYGSRLEIGVVTAMAATGIDVSTPEAFKSLNPGRISPLVRDPLPPAAVFAGITKSHPF